MNHIPFALGGAAVGVWASLALQSLPVSAYYAPHGQPLRCAQWTAARHLKFPQSYQAMINLLGYPDHRTPSFDLYKTPGGYLEITYLSDGRAWGATGGGCGW